MQIPVKLLSSAHSVELSAWLTAFVARPWESIDFVILTEGLCRWFDNNLSTVYRGARHYDGGLTNFIPLPPGLRAGIRVCCFPSKQLSPVYNIQISPDSFEVWPYNLREVRTATLTSSCRCLRCIVFLVTYSKSSMWHHTCHLQIPNSPYYRNFICPLSFQSWKNLPETFFQQYLDTELSKWMQVSAHGLQASLSFE